MISTGYLQGYTCSGYDYSPWLRRWYPLWTYLWKNNSQTSSAIFYSAQDRFAEDIEAYSIAVLFKIDESVSHFFCRFGI